MAVIRGNRVRRHARLVARVVAFLAFVAIAGAPFAFTRTPAGAAVATEPSAVAPGDVVTFAFQVVNDRTPHATTRVAIDFPDEPAIVNADAVPVPGWTIRMERHRLEHPVPTPDGAANDAVRRLVWTGGPLQGAGVVRFTVHVGPIASSVRHVEFTAAQTYDDGTVVRWRDDPAKEPSRHPAPFLVVSRFAASRPAGAADPLGAPFNLTEKHAIDRRVRLLVRNGEVATPDDLESARWLSLLAVVAGVAGFVLGGAAFLTVRRAVRAGSQGDARASAAPPDEDEGLPAGDGTPTGAPEP